MAKATLKDLRTTYRVLSKMSNAAVPHDLLVTLAEMIKKEEKTRAYNKIARLSEEDLIRYQATPKRRLRINLPDGRIVQEKTNEMTFYTVLKELDFADALALNLKKRGKPLFVGFKEPRKQLTGHKMIRESCFVLRITKSDERLELLRQLDELLQLNWDIILI